MELILRMTWDTDLLAWLASWLRFGGAPRPPPVKMPPPPPPPLPPAAVLPDTEAQRAVTRETQRTRRRFGVRQTLISGAPIGIAGDRPLGV